MMNQLFTSILLFLFVFTINQSQVNATTNELPECVVRTHCVRKNFTVKNVESAFKKASKILSETPRTKIIEQTNSYIHAEAKTKWRRYTDDFLIKAIPEKGIIQVRSESRVGIGDNGINQNRVDDFTSRLMTELHVAS